MDAHKVLTSKKFGPGGPTCSCCNWGKDAKKQAQRYARRELKKALKLVALEE